MPAKEKLQGYKRYNVKTEEPESHCNFSAFPALVPFWKNLSDLFADTRVSGKRSGRLQIFDHRAEIDRLRIECFVFCDLRPIQNLEPVALEHFLSAPAFKCDDLTVNAFFAGPVEITQIRAHQGACR